jgi:hypothetical protein
MRSANTQLTQGIVSVAKISTATAAAASKARTVRVAAENQPRMPKPPKTSKVCFSSLPLAMHISIQIVNVHATENLQRGCRVILKQASLQSLGPAHSPHNVEPACSLSCTGMKTCMTHSCLNINHLT